MFDGDNVGWSAEEDRKLARMWCAEDPPRSTREIAADLDKSKSAVDRRVHALGLRGHKGDRAHYERMTGVSLDPVFKPVRVEPQQWPERRSLPKDEVKLLFWSDVHFPFQDDSSLCVMMQIAEDFQPDILVAGGDFFDFFELSDHRAPKDIEPDIQETLNQGVAHLAAMRGIKSVKEAWFLGGNHEDRWDRMMEKTRRDVRFRELLKIPSIRAAMEFEEIVGFDELGYEYIPYVESRPLVIDGLVFTHGDRTNKHVAMSMVQKYGKSVIFGHMHRIQNFTQRDLKGQDAGWCVGCLCTLDPHYSIMADWHQGFVTVTFSNGLFNVEQVRIHKDGEQSVALWRDQKYGG